MTKLQRILCYWPCAWLDLIDSITWILTLGLWKTDFGMDYRIWDAKKRLRERMKNDK